MGGLMTSPESVGSVSVEVIGEAKDLAKRLRRQVEDSVKGVDLSAKMQEALGKSKLKVPVSADVDPNEIPEKVKKGPKPKVGVEVDPLLTQFQQQLRRQVASLARTVNANVPVTADTDGLRSELNAELRAVAQTSRMQVPTEPGARAAYEAKLRANLAVVAAKVKQTVRVEPVVDQRGLGGLGGGGRGGIAGLGNVFRGLGSGIPIVGALTSSVGRLLGVIGQVGGTAAGMGSRVAGSFASIAGPITSAVGAILAAQAAVAGLTAGVALAVPVLGAMQAAILAVAGAAAALPGALTGIGAAVGTLALGFKGISEAFEPKTGGGGGGGNSAASQARQVAAASRGVEAARRGIAAANRAYEASLRSLAAAERGLLAAQRAVTQAQEDYAAAQDRALRSQQAVDRARKTAKENIDDLARSLRGAVLSEAEAALALDEAALALSEAQQTGDLKKIRAAELAYERAKLAIDETADATQDLREEADEANAKGVEGSDEVQDALRDQREAWEAVEDAQQGVADAMTGVVDATDALKSAQDGVTSALDGQKAAADGLKSAQDSLAAAQQKVAAGGGAVGKEVTKLAPAAQRFVDAVKALKPAFEDLRLDVQERLFRNLDKTVTKVGEAWIPALKTTLGSYADTFNGFFRNLGTAISQPRFITDLQTGAEGVRRGLERIGQSITDSLVPAFGTLARRSGPFLEKMGELLAEAIDRFGEWIDKAEKSGKLQTFFEKTAQAMGDIARTGKEVGRLIGNIVGILLGGNGKNDKSAIDSFNDGLASLNDWLAKPDSRKKIAEFVDDVKGIFTEFRDTYQQVKPFLDALFGTGGDQERNASGLGARIGSALVTGIITGLLTFNGVLLQTLADMVVGPNGFVARVNRWLGIESPSTVFAEIGRNVILGLIDGVGSMLGALARKAAEIPGKVLDGVKDLAGLVRRKGVEAVNGLIAGAGERFAALRQQAVNAKTTVTNTLANAGTWLRTNGQQAIGGLYAGMSAQFGNLRTVAGQARSWVVNTLANAGSWLRSTGQNVIIGLYNGIASYSNWLWNRVASFARNYVTNAIKGALGISSPSKVAMGLGAFVSQGVALGIDSEAGKVQAAADRIAAAAIPDVTGANVGLDLSAGSIASSLAVADRQSLVASWKAGATGDQLLDALASLIDLRYRGDVQAALSRA